MPVWGRSHVVARVVGAYICITSAETAHANWVTNKTGPDVFDTTTVVSIAVGGSKNFVVQCDDKDQLTIALIFPKKKFEEVYETPAELLIQSDHGATSHLLAELRSWNDDYAGVVAEGRTPEVIKILRDIRLEHEKLNAGIVVGGLRDSASFEADGSTNAMDIVFKDCKLGDAVSSR
jgi:hypothetical protein